MNADDSYLVYAVQARIRQISFELWMVPHTLTLSGGFYFFLSDTEIFAVVDVKPHLFINM